MVKLTVDLIEQAEQFTNPVRDRELQLRGYKFPMIENLGATLDQFDTIDMTDNEVRKLDGFPLLRRLKNLLLGNNRIQRIASGLEECLPNLETLILTNNNLQELGDIDSLQELKKLTTVSFMRNPIANKKDYRLYIIHKLPQVRILDFQRVRKIERDTATKMFKGKKGQALAEDLGKKSNTFVPGEPVKVPQRTAAEKEERDLIKKAIENADSMESVEKLQAMLKSGQVPGRDDVHMDIAKAANGDREDEDMDT
ncbi:DgyrCDS7826 [Dimorphilus gyrociliatus]|uniref:DgyrCDS7826 n=1 Tax=Dimorphilus gyrociliatus TaxID=2664684 RepID=A0A7I8VS95_9ANNE|nr:DgyrCDS7826 [Dimorphilus gyrociliatus]